MAGIVRKGRDIKYVRDLEEVQAIFGIAEPYKVQVFGFERLPKLSWITAATKRAHASITLHVDRATAVELIAQQGWMEPTVWSRLLPHAAGVLYMDDSPEPEPEPGPEEEEQPAVKVVHRVRRTRAIVA
jgi:hypothetical protein